MRNRSYASDAHIQYDIYIVHHHYQARGHSHCTQRIYHDHGHASVVSISLTHRGESLSKRIEVGPLFDVSGDVDELSWFDEMAHVAHHLVRWNLNIFVLQITSAHTLQIIIIIVNIIIVIIIIKLIIMFTITHTIIIILIITIIIIVIIFILLIIVIMLIVMPIIMLPSHHYIIIIINSSS